MSLTRGDSKALGRWGISPETDNLVAEKISYFPKLYKIAKVLEDVIENGFKKNFPLRFSYVNLKIFSKNFTLHWFLAQMRKYLQQGFLNTFSPIKAFH